jgi:hypothetical protein
LVVSCARAATTARPAVIKTTKILRMGFLWLMNRLQGSWIQTPVPWKSCCPPSRRFGMGLTKKSERAK